MKGIGGPESMAFQQIIAGIEAQIPVPNGVAWRKRNWGQAWRRGGLRHTESAAAGVGSVQQSKSKEEQQPAEPTENREITETAQQDNPDASSTEGSTP